MENMQALPAQMQAEQTEKKHLPRPKRRYVMMSCAVLLIAAALVLNFMLFEKPAVQDPAASTGAAGATQSGQTDVAAPQNEDGYFSATQVSRKRARDEALEVLQGVVESEDVDEATKTGALKEISDLAAAMEAEANIESLICSKGFSQCVAVINGDTCSVVVNGTELQEQQISQINEIVYEQAGILPVNIRIITRS